MDQYFSFGTLEFAQNFDEFRRTGQDPAAGQLGHGLQVLGGRARVEQLDGIVQQLYIHAGPGHFFPRGRRGHLQVCLAHHRVRFCRFQSQAFAGSRRQITVIDLQRVISSQLGRQRRGQFGVRNGPACAQVVHRGLLQRFVESRSR